MCTRHHPYLRLLNKSTQRFPSLGKNRTGSYPSERKQHKLRWCKNVDGSSTSGKETRKRNRRGYERWNESGKRILRKQKHNSSFLSPLCSFLCLSHDSFLPAERMSVFSRLTTCRNGVNLTLKEQREWNVKVDRDDERAMMVQPHSAKEHQFDERDLWPHLWV